ncbi:TPA: DUF3899 domain-containing protein, partial [Listeria monocytogenes]
LVGLQYAGILFSSFFVMLTSIVCMFL